VAALRPIINPKEAVRFIRMGLSDEGLMRKYGISARGLESLFRKLVRAGELDSSELDQRTVLFEKSQSVILAGPPEPCTPKIQIDAVMAVAAIRSGLSDLELMQKFSLSAKGVDKLFRKLIHAGLLGQEELDQRAYASQMFQVAELDELPEPVVQKPRVKAASAVRDIRQDMSDAALMEKYGLSSKGLESLFRKLVQAGEIMHAELDHRLLDTRSSHYVDLDEPAQTNGAKCRINAAEALLDVRSGLSDAAIMKKYDISIRGLNSLFRKLVLAGRIEQAELDRRTIVSQQSHFVDLEERPEPAVAKIRVKASDLAACIRSGMNDAALMEKFCLSARGLEGLFRKMVAAGKIRPAELDARRNSRYGADLSFEKDPSDSDANRQQDEDAEFELESFSMRGRAGVFWEAHRTAVLAVSAGIVLVIVAIALNAHVLIVSRFSPRSEHARMLPAKTPEEIRQQQITELSAILEDISQNPYRQATLEGIPGAQNLQKCLKNCSRDHPSADPTDRGLLLNCRMECMARHGKAIKAIRQRYYEDDTLD
jgi:hypothetical protein